MNYMISSWLHMLNKCTAMHLNICTIHIFNSLNSVFIENNFSTFSGLWAVVNNAGISDWAEIEWSSIEDYRHMVDINLFGSIRTSFAFLPLVRAAKG